MSQQSQPKGTYYLHTIDGVSVQVHTTIPIETMDWSDESDEGQANLKQQCLAMFHEVQALTQGEDGTLVHHASNGPGYGTPPDAEYELDPMQASSSFPLSQLVGAHTSDESDHDDDAQRDDSQSDELEAPEDHLKHVMQAQQRSQMTFTSPEQALLFHQYDPLFFDTGYGALIMQDFDLLDLKTQTTGEQRFFCHVSCACKHACFSRQIQATFSQHVNIWQVAFA